MNVRKGIQRLAVFVGVLGAIAGGFASYVDLHDLMATRASHKAFEALVNSDVVQQERKSLNKIPPPPSGDIVSSLKPESGAQGADHFAAYGGHEIQPDKGTVTAWDAQGNPITSKPARSATQSDIKAIDWTTNLGVASIDTEDGQTLYPVPAPSFWLYLLAALFPIIGFFIPWGLIRAVGWVGAGFFESPEPS